MNIDFLAEHISNNPIAFFCGAGISFQSGIPLVSHITEEVFEALSVPQYHIKEFIKKKIPFESFMEVLLTHTDARHLMKIFNSNSPGQTHIFLSLLARHGISSVFITTNFDTLLEKAFEQNRVKFKTYFSNEDFANVNFESKNNKIIKLHGCISDIETLAVTIKNVANQFHVTGRHKLLKNLFSHSKCNSTIILGYSRSDKFDINPAIKNAANKMHNIFLVDHFERSKENYYKLLNISKKFHPFTNYPGKVIRGDTDRIIVSLWNNLLSEPIPQYKINKIPWKENIRIWLDDAKNVYGQCIVPTISALLFKASKLYKISNCYANEALAFEKVPKNNDIRSLALQTLGDNHRDLGNFDVATTYLEDALVTAKTQGSKKRLARAELSLGVVLEDQAKTLNEPLKRMLAAKRYESALLIAREIKDFEVEGKCEGNLGIIYKNLETSESLMRATFHHIKALRLARKVGDKESEGRSYGNLGATFTLRGKEKVAFRCYERAIMIAHDLGDDRHVGIWTANTGEDYIGIDQDKAIFYLRKAVKIFNSIGLPHYVEYCENLIKEIKSSLKNINKA